MERQKARWSHKPPFIFQNKESRLKDSTVCRYVTPCSLGEGYIRFGESAASIFKAKE
jgi:hypothetical protein